MFGKNFSQLFGAIQEKRFIYGVSQLRQRTILRKLWRVTRQPFTPIVTIRAGPGFLQQAGHWLLNVEAIMHPFGVDFEITAKAVPSRSPYKNNLTYKSKRQSIYYYIFQCTLLLLFFLLFHRRLTKFRGEKFSTITDYIDINL